MRQIIKVTFFIFLLLAFFIIAVQAEDNFSPTSKVCPDPKSPCKIQAPAMPEATFEPNHLSFKLPTNLEWGNNINSSPFYAVILKSIKAVPDNGPDSGKKCSGYISEKSRLEIQVLFPDKKVFASRFGCSDDNISYTNTNSQYNFMAVYAGETKEEADKTLEQVKAMGKFPTAGLRKMQVVFQYGD